MCVEDHVLIGLNQIFIKFLNIYTCHLLWNNKVNLNW